MQASLKGYSNRQGLMFGGHIKLTTVLARILTSIGWWFADLENQSIITIVITLFRNGDRDEHTETDANW